MYHKIYFLGILMVPSLHDARSLINIRPNFNSLCSHFFTFNPGSFTKTEGKILRPGNGNVSVPFGRRVLKTFPHTISTLSSSHFVATTPVWKAPRTMCNPQQPTSKKDDSSICWRWEDTLSKTDQLSNPSSVSIRAEIRLD